MLLSLTANSTLFSLDPAWFSVAISFIMLILTVCSVFYAYRAYKHQKDRSKKDAACALAKYYAENIISKHMMVTLVFTSTGLAELIRNTLDMQSLRDFDRDELQRLLKRKGVTEDSFKQQMSNIDPQSILDAQMSCTSSEADRGQKAKSYLDKDQNGKYHIINGSFLQHDFLHEVSNLLNNLEWFAMNCRYGLADEEILYQSLHQTFLSTIWMLYYHISVNNVENQDKYFTNLIWLFCLWRDRLNKIVDEAEAKRIKEAQKYRARTYDGVPLK